MIAWPAAALAVILAIHFWPGPPSLVPPYVRTQASLAHFSIIYPSDFSIDASSWKYLPDQKSVQFKATKNGTGVVFTEEATPLAYQNDVASYNRFIGSLRPRANFDVPLGTVSISNFVTQGDYQVVGETGILNTNGTLLLAHPDKNVSDDDWRALFESLKID